MAWPNTPLTSYSANTTPVIHAGDLNSIQDAINRIVVATYSLKAVVVDGTGGSVVAPVAGTVSVTGVDGTGGAAPTTSVPLGTAYKAGIVHGWAVYSSGLGLLRGYNVFAAPAPAGVGNYSITFNSVVTDPTKACVVVTAGNGANGYIATVNTKTSVGGKLQVQILVADYNGAAQDCDVNIIAFGY